MIKVEYIDHMGDDLRHVNAARATFDNWKTDYEVGTDDRLIGYLVRNHETEPMRHIQITMRCHAPIPIARQLAKHQVGMVWSEVSRRYVKSTPEIFKPEYWRYAPEESIKQGSAGPMPHHHQVWNDEDYQEATQVAVRAYERMIERGTAPEQARFVLPQGMMTTWVWTGSLQAWSHLHWLRVDEKAQGEVEEFGRQVAEIASWVAPDTWLAVLRHS